MLFNLKKLCLFISIVWAMVAINISVSADTLYAGDCGDNALYSVDNNYNLIISGTGAMVDYESSYTSNRPWYEYRRDITSITIESGITYIGAFAFSGCRNVPEIIVPDSVSAFGTRAFMDCHTITEFTIPNGVKILPYGIFYSCTSLQSIRIPNTITSIEQNAFADCPSLTTVYFYGTEDEWNAIEIADGNEALLKAEKVFIPEVQPTSITLTSNKSTYIIGEDTELDITVNLNYNDGTSTLLSPDEYTIATDFDPTTEGEYKVKAIYGDFTDEITVSVEPLRVTGIAITTQPDKTEFIEGTELDLSGMVVTATYNNGTTEDVTAQCEVIGYDSSTVGTKTLTVSYKGYSCTLDINVVEKSIVGIRIVSPPDKLRYSNDETELDLTGLVVEALYDNDTVSEITNYTVSGFDDTKAGTQTITVSYNGFTAEFEVFVKIYEYKVDSEIGKNYDFDTQTLTVGTTITSRTDAGAVKVIVAVYGDNGALMKTTIKDVFFDTKEQKHLNMALDGVSYPFGKVKVFVWGYDLTKMIPMAIGV